MLYDDDEVDRVEPNDAGPLLGGRDGRPSSLSSSLPVVTVDSMSPPEPRAVDKSYSSYDFDLDFDGIFALFAALFLLLRHICKRLCEQGSGDQTTSQDERPLTMTHGIPPWREVRLGGTDASPYRKAYHFPRDTGNQSRQLTIYAI